MAKFIRTYCKKCGCETTHTIWKEDFLENTGVARILWGVLTAGVSMWDSVTYCKCCSCGTTKRI